MRSEFLNQQQGPVAGGDELEAFGDGVEEIRSAAERLDLRLAELERKKGGGA